MIYTIKLNENEYAVKINKNTVLLVKEKLEQKEMEVQYDEILPEFNFGDVDKESSVCSTMYGKIVQVYAEEGREVSKNDILAVMESMKMEIDIVAPTSGKIIRVNIQAGDMVKGNEELFLIGE